MKTLTIGTEKQINWANEIRCEVIATCESRRDGAQKMIDKFELDETEPEHGTVKLENARIEWLKDQDSAGQIINIKTIGWSFAGLDVI